MTEVDFFKHLDVSGAIVENNISGGINFKVDNTTKATKGVFSAYIPGGPFSI